MIKKNFRFIAALIIADVLRGRSLSTAFAKHLLSSKDHKEQAQIQFICYGVCRFFPRLNFILKNLLKKPVTDAPLHALLLIGLYQLMSMRTARHAAVCETVNAAKRLPKKSGVNLVNAILREFLRREEEIQALIENNVAAKWNHPQWWINKTKAAYPQNWQAILAANDEKAPLVLRVNQQKMTPANYLQRLHAADIAAALLSCTEAGIILDEPLATAQLPHFDQGFVSVQSAAAQFAAVLLDVQKGERVLDACAAPGGKIAHLIERQPDAYYLALDKDKKRIKVVQDHLNRLQLVAKVCSADAAEPSTWWDGQAFDRILLDAPCSASGVVRKHPDIKLLRKPGDIEKFVVQQTRLLNGLWPTLACRGLLLYATCSIFPEENTELIARFLAEHQDAEVIQLLHPLKAASKWGLQILPDQYPLDGFFYALIRKTSC